MGGYLAFDLESRVLGRVALAWELFDDELEPGSLVEEELERSLLDDPMFASS